MAKQYTKDELSEWLQGKAAKATPGAARSKLFNATQREEPDVFTGNLYLFKYDPKGKNYLPKYDKYQLTIVLERYQDSFLGLNLHYLSRGQRGTLLYAIDKYKQTGSMRTGVYNGKGTTNWESLMNRLDGTGLKSYPPICIKRYLYSHVRSRFILIKPDEYSIAVQLPLEEFVYKV